MNHKALFVAGAILLAPATGLASSHGASHPALPDALSPEPVHESPFAAAVPLLDRGAPSPSHWPPSDEAASELQRGMPVDDHTDHGTTMHHEGMSHSGMSHDGMSHGEAGAPPVSAN